MDRLTEGGQAGPLVNVISGGGALQKVQTQYATAVAVQKPRSITKVLNAVIDEARLAGKSFYYGWKVKDNKTGKKVPIEGPSIDLAMCIARNYGNCVIDIDAKETPTHFIMKGIFIDLESGFTVPRLFRQVKNLSIGSKYDKDRAEDITFQIAQSKAQRNAIIKAAPEWMVTRAIAEAKQAETSKIENIAEARASAVAYFQDSWNIAQDRIEGVVGRKVDDWTKMDLVDLRGTITAIKEGRVTAEEAFPVIDPAKDLSQDIKANVKTPDPGTGKEGQEGQDEGQNEGQPNYGPWNPENWKNTRPGNPEKGTGFAAYCKAHEALYPDLPDSLKAEIKGKWKRLYPSIPFALEPPEEAPNIVDPPPPGDPPPDNQGAEAGQLDLGPGVNHTAKNVPATEDLTEEAERLAKIKAIRMAFDEGTISEAKNQLNIFTYTLEQMNIDMLLTVQEQCEKVAKF